MCIQKRIQQMELFVCLYYAGAPNTGFDRHFEIARDTPSTFLAEHQKRSHLQQRPRHSRSSVFFVVSRSHLRIFRLNARRYFLITDRVQYFWAVQTRTTTITLYLYYIHKHRPRSRINNISSRPTKWQNKIIYRTVCWHKKNIIKIIIKSANIVSSS